MWACKQCEDDGRSTLQHSIIGLDLRHEFLCFFMYLCVVVYILTDLFRVVQADKAHLAEVESLGGDADQTIADTEHEEDRLQRNVTHCFPYLSMNPHLLNSSYCLFIFFIFF